MFPPEKFCACDLPLSYSGFDDGARPSRAVMMENVSPGGTVHRSRGGKSMALPTRPLGASGLELTAVGFGAWAIGGADWAFTWGPQDDDASIAAMRRAVELGINWIDTAAV
jgi:hypothetical protein